MEGYSCIKNRGVHEDRKHDEDCEGGEKWDLPLLLQSLRRGGLARRSFEAVMRGLEWEAEEEPAFATIPTVSA